MATNAILGRDVYLALAAVGWADGDLTEEGADAIVRTALEEGLPIEEIAEIEEATKKRLDIGVVDRVGMSKSDRLYVYAVAAWICELDGPRSKREEEALNKLGAELGIPEKPREHANTIMKEIADGVDRPAHFDLRALRDTLDARLEAAREARISAVENEKPEPPPDAE